MAAITTRAGKGSPLTNVEMDANLNNMNAAIGGTLTTIASATTPDIFVVTSGPIIDYTGTATCTGFVAAPQAGATRTLVCAGAAVFTAGANMLIDGVASGSNLTAAVQDKVIVTAVTTTQFRLSIVRYAGVVSTSDLQAQLVTAFTTGGTSTAFTLTPSPAITANATNQRFRVKFNAASGATPTLAVSGQTAKNLKYYDSTGAKQAITSTQVPTNWISDVEYDGTDWVVLNPVQPVTSGPTFSAYANASQTVTVNTITKVSLQAENFDTASAFDAATNYRFQPLVAGYYQINASVELVGGVSTAQFVGYIYKNGSVFGSRLWDVGSSAALASNGSMIQSGSVIIYLNGSTDYVELYGYYFGGTATFSSTSSDNTSQMSGVFIRS